ncbi:MAG: hypothetical protein JW929_09785 [Anaerolineales bacterium]|nr:hypothetical protein [Anaerolineales bacterium]
MPTSDCRTCPDTYSVSTTRYSPAAPSLPKQSSVCPTCGGIECLCRPRFFDGQLLSADDLTRLDRYIVAKNRLHNRYLHGWGVVCGLEAVCDPCQDQVTVRKGYALSPCGDDITVCADVTVPVCDLITQCRRTSTVDCYGNTLTAAERGCEDAEETWILSICYDEKPSRGITALQASSGAACCSKCSCGGSTDCECICYEVPAAAPTSSSRHVPAQCEPSVLCEGFRFSVSKATPAQTSDSRKRLQGEMVSRFNACLREVYSILPDPPQNKNDLEQSRRYLCELLESMRDFFSTRSSYDCQLDEKLAAIAIPRRSASMTDQQFGDVLIEVYYQLLEILVAYLRYCLCNTLLPPCPDPPADNCVPLAAVKIQRSGCRILSVCNFSTRRIALTVPALSYWLSWAPIEETLQKMLSSLCCVSLKIPREQRTSAAGVPVNAAAAVNYSANFSSAQPTSSPEGAAKKKNGNQKTAKETAQVFAQAWAGRSAEFDLQNLILDAMGMVNEQGLPYLSPEERRNPLATLLANRIAVPLADAFTPDRPADISNLDRILKVQTAEAQAAKDQQAAGEKPAPGISSAELKELRAQVETLKKTVAEQQRRIDSLPKRQTRQG